MPPPPPATWYPAPPDSTYGEAGAVVQTFYAYINAGMYREAYELGSPDLFGDYATFAEGYSGTLSVTVGIDYVEGGVAHVTIVSEHYDGTVTQYVGTYTVSGGQIVAADISEY